MGKGSWGHRIRPLNHQEMSDQAAREGGWSCSVGKNHGPVAYIAEYDYVTGRAGRVTTARRMLCEAHAIEFCRRHGMVLAI